MWKASQKLLGEKLNARKSTRFLLRSCLGKLREAGRSLLGKSRWIKLEQIVISNFLRLKGNRVEVDGCVFDVSSPLISRAEKRELFFDYYEGRERKLIFRYFDPSMALVELGGCLGVVSCTTNRRLNDPTKHIVVEANPAIISVLERNRELNHSAFTLVNSAIAYGNNHIPFFTSARPTRSGLYLASKNATLVPTSSLQAILEKAGFCRCVLICDIEGAELALIRNELSILTKYVKRIICELHPHISTPAELAEIQQRLLQGGFQLHCEENDIYVFENALLSDSID